MKKILLSSLCLLFAFVAFAQVNPNRMVVQPKQGNPVGYLVERIDSVYFAKIEGRVAADVQFKHYKTGKADTVVLSVTMTPECKGFRIACIPAVRANALTSDASVAAYLERAAETMYSQDFTNAEMYGFEESFKPATDYALITMGYDKYGVACSASRSNFTTPAAQVVGSPSVDWKVDELGSDKLVMTFTANDDCANFATCLFKAGEAQAQFEQWAPMMGFANMGDMIKRWSGKLYQNQNTQTWNNLTPDTDYEIYVLPLDVNGNYGSMVIANVKTKAIGGEGLAEMTIEIGRFGGDADNGYYQEVIYTPNDQASLHRDMIITTEAYNKPEWGEAGVKAFLMKDNPMDPNWNQYGVDAARWNADPSTEYIAFSMARNIKGEWGPLASKPFTTPASASAVNAAKVQIPYRLNSSVSNVGVMPSAFKNGMMKRGVCLVQK